MKVIPKLLDGGLTSLFTTYTPTYNQTPSEYKARGTSSRGTSSREDDEIEEKSNKGKLTEKDLFELVSKVDGLPNDLLSLVRNLSDMFLILLLTGDSDISNMANLYLSNVFQIKLAKFNKQKYDNVYKEVVKNGGLNEYAITDSGLVIVTDKENNLQLVSASELLKNPDKYIPLTNSNLLHLRAYRPEYVNNNNILDTVSNGIGMELVDKMIRERLSSLGSSDKVRSGYSIKTDLYIAQGLNVLSLIESALLAGQAGMTLDGMYKNKLITKDLKLQAEAALNYIYNTLPNNAKTLLSIKSGNASSPKDGALAIIMLLITSRMNLTDSLETIWQGTIEQVTKTPGKGKSGSGNDSGLGSDDIKTDPYYLMSRGQGGENSSITINKGTEYQMSVDGVLYSSLPGLNGLPIGRTSLLNALLSGLQGVITDPQAITFGDVPISPNDFENIMFDGTAGGTLAILPTKLSINGTKTVDLDALDRWEAANKLLKDMGIESIYDPNRQLEIIQVLYLNRLENLVNVASGTVDYSAFGLFMIVDGYAVDNSSKNTFKNSSYISKVDNDSEEIPMIEKALSTDNDLKNYEIDVNNWYDLDGYNIVYKGSIYLPITSNLLKALTASKLNIKEGPAMEKEYEFQMLNKRLLAKQPLIGII